MRVQVAGASQIVAPYGASPVRAGGGTIAWWAGDGNGVRVLDGPMYPNAGLCDVSPEGRYVITPEYQVGEGLEVYDASGVKFATVQTGPLGAAAGTGYNVRLRAETLLWQDTAGWHLVPPIFTPRTETIALAVQVRTPNGRIALLELSERLTIRWSNRTVGIVITEADTFYPDAALSGDDTIAVAWSSAPLEVPSNLGRRSVTMAELDAAPTELNASEPPVPVDCQVSDWTCSGWLPDDHGTTESRTCWRKVTQQPANGGKSCPELSKIETRPIEEPPMPVPTDRQKQIEALGFKCFGGFFQWTDVADCTSRVNQVAGIGADVMGNANFVPSEFEAGQGLGLLFKHGPDTPEAQQAVRRFFEGRK